MLKHEVRRSVDKLLRLSFEKVAHEKGFPFVRSRLKAIALSRAFLHARHDHFLGLDAFKPLRDSIRELDRILLGCEIALRRYAVEEIDPLQLDESLNESIDQLTDICDLKPQGSARSKAAADVAELMEREWQSICELGPRLQDSLQGTWDLIVIEEPAWRKELESDRALAPRHTGIVE